MTEKEILTRIEKIIREDIAIDDEYAWDESLLTTGVMDSMDWMAFLTRVEDDFGIEISSAEADRHSIAILNNLIKYLTAKSV